MSAYPGGIYSPPTRVDGTDQVIAADFNNPAAEIVAIETELGISPKGSFTDVKTRLNRHDTLGAAMSRASTSAVNSGTGVRTLTGYDTDLHVDAGFTVNHGAGAITVPSDGWYLCEAHARPSGAPVTDVIQVTIGTSTVTDLIRGPACSASTYDAAVNGTIYVTAATVLQASVFTGSTQSFVGNTNGTYYYFRVVRL